MRAHRSYFLSNAPWSIISTMVFGGANYAIVVLLSWYYNAEDVGSFRILLSVVSILGFASMTASDRPALQSVVVGKDGVIVELFRNRVKWSLLGTVAGLMFSAYWYWQGNSLYLALIPACLVLPILYSSDLFLQVFEGRRDYRMNAFFDVFRFGSVVLAFGIGAWFKVNILILFASYFIILAFVNWALYLRTRRTLDLQALGDGTEVRDAIRLSLSNILRNLPEHADKFLIGYYFGYKVLGFYVIGVSTGRLLLFFMNPILAVFNPLLVKSAVSLSLLTYLFLIATAIGVVGSFFLDSFFLLMFDPAYLEMAYLARYIFWGAGIYCIGTVLYNTSTYNLAIPMFVPIANNIISPTIILTYLLLSVMYGSQYALALCALSYPLQALVNTITLTVIKGVYKIEPQSDSIL